MKPFTNFLKPKRLQFRYFSINNNKHNNLKFNDDDNIDVKNIENSPVEINQEAEQKRYMEIEESLKEELNFKELESLLKSTKMGGFKTYTDNKFSLLDQVAKKID